MPRIPETEIDRIKTETDLIALIQSRGVKLKQQGKNWTGLCPFHDDKKTPNLIVTPCKGLFRCMASHCGKTGNALHFVQFHDGVSFRHAFEILDNGGKAAYVQTKGTAKKSTVPKLPCPLDAKADESALLERVSKYYHSRLTTPDGRAVLDYLKKRGLDDEAMVRKFNIGLSDRTLGLRLPQANRKEGAELRDKLKTLGVYRQNGREHLNGCLTVPIIDIEGNPVQIYGRRLGQAPKENRHLYLARPLAGIFNPEALKNREIILTESILDALTFYRHGMEAVTCSFGTENFTAELFDAIKAAKVESVKLAYDADAAGEKAAAKAAAKLQAVGIECHQIKFPWGQDANSYALDQGGEALKKAVRDASWIEPDKSLSTVPLVTNLVAKEEEILSPQTVEPETNAPPEVELIKVGDYHEMQHGSRAYRVGGLEKNSSLEVLRITLRVSCEGLMHVDSLDLYRDGERRKFIERAADETMLERDLLKRDLGKLLLALEQYQEQRLNSPTDDPEAVSLTSAEEAEALQLLQSPDLLTKIAAAYDDAGIVGEETNKIAAYLACASRKLAKPLAVIIQSTSAAGKSTLMDAVLSFFPNEEQVKYSAMTGQSLYYLGESNLKHKILAIVEEEGAEKASYALKLLQSEGELTIASTGKDPHSGRMETQEYHVEGPVAIMLTTTSIDIDEELMNRCLVLTVDESKEQTERIHELQREARTIEGILAAEKRKDVIRMMQNAQRLLKPWKIANPYARHLTFTSGRTRTRRDHEKYLTLIDSIALLHQHQREPITHTLNGREVQMLPVTIEDIETANRIAPEVLGRSLDELPPQTRGLLESIKALVREKMKAEKVEQRLSLFSRKELRDSTGWSHTQIRRHLERLLELEYISTRGGRNGIQIKYELLTDAEEDGTGYHVGLLDVAKLRKKKSA
jgi:DNA primase catalytic core